MEGVTVDWERYADAQGELLGLPLTPEQRAGVVRYLGLVGGLAPRVMDFPLTPADESGNVFVPVPPGEGDAR
jgi:hypothetical protein